MKYLANAVLYLIQCNAFDLVAVITDTVKRSIPTPPLYGLQTQDENMLLSAHELVGMSRFVLGKQQFGFELLVAR